MHVLTAEGVIAEDVLTRFFQDADKYVSCYTEHLRDYFLYALEKKET